VDARGHQLGIGLGDPVEGGRVLARHHFHDVLEPVRAVAGIDPLGRVAQLEIDAGLEAGRRGEHGAADLAGQARINRRFEDHDRARLQPRPDHAAGAFEGAQIGPALLVDRRRHRHDEEARRLQIVGIVGEANRALPQRIRADFARAIVAALELGDALPGDVEADHGRELPREGERHRQADVTETQDREAALGHAFGPSLASRSR